MRDQYKNHPTSPAGWTCINSVEGLRGNTQWSNRDFVINNKYKSRGYKKIPLDNSNIEEVYNNMPVGSIIQTPNYGHSVMYLGDNLFYNNHGSYKPYKNGN